MSNTKKEVSDNLNKENLVVTKNINNDTKTKDLTKVDLNDKVDDFINWYFKNMVKGNLTDIGEYRMVIEMRNFIEKMAVWYELRYPDYEINRLMHCTGQEQIDINDVMFNENKYINDLLEENHDIKYLDWDKFYNARTFIRSLPNDEIRLFSKPIYKDLVYLNPDERKAHLHLTKNGIVEMSEYVGKYSNFLIKDEELKGLHIRKVVELFKERGVKLPDNNELEMAIKKADKWIYQKEEMLNCVMYRIIERGGNRIGPRRAFLFAKDFNRNIDIPMMYAIDYSDPGLRSFMNEYIKAGGSKDLDCYVDYFSKTNKKEKIDTVSINELILTLNNNAATFYTEEEEKLHQRLVNALANYIDEDELKKEILRKSRIGRRLEKSIMNKMYVKK